MNFIENGSDWALMLNVEDDFDPWTQKPVAAASACPGLDAQTIAEIEPLNDQFGADAPKTVPDALYGALFGQPKPTDDELTQADGDPANVALLHTYAILDAAKVTNLPELLETSGLKHCCLFKGAAFDELKDVAPWIVRLEEGSTFTRNLFTRSDAPWHIWDREAGIYLRSRSDLATLVSHFRRFTRLQETNGSWRYFRFWEPLTLQAYLSAAAQRSYERCPMLYDQETQMVTGFVCCPVPGDITVHTVLGSHVPSNSSIGPRFTHDHERMIGHAMQGRRQSEITLALRKGFGAETDGLSKDELDRLVVYVVQKTGRCQIRSIRHVHTFAAWQLIYGVDFEQRDPSGFAAQILASSLPEEQKMVQLGKRLDEVHSAGLL